MRFAHTAFITISGCLHDGQRDRAHIDPPAGGMNLPPRL